MTQLTISEARAALPDLVTRVEGGAEITITRHGRPVAVLVSPENWHTRRAHDALADADRIQDLLDAAAGAPLVPELTERRAEELIQDIRDTRDGRSRD